VLIELGSGLLFFGLQERAFSLGPPMENPVGGRLFRGLSPGCFFPRPPETDNIAHLAEIPF
jgi:hypothetical protein